MVYITVYVENENFVVFKYHFETGKLSKSRLGQVVRGEATSERMYFDGANLFLDCSVSIFKKILDGLYPNQEEDVDYFLGLESVETQVGSSNKEDAIEISVLDGGFSLELTDNNEVNDLEKMFDDIDTVSTPMNPENGSFNTDVLIGGDKTEIDKLVNTLHQKLNSNNSNQVINMLSNDKNIQNIIKGNKLEVTESPAMTLSFNENTTEVKTDTEYQNVHSDSSGIKTKYIDIN